MITPNGKWNGIYRIPSARKPGYDYGLPGIYYVTICCKPRDLRPFGQIKKAQMHLSALGKLADQSWRAIPERFPNVTLDAHIIMPDHLHGIIQINRPGKKKLREEKSPRSTDVAPQRLPNRSQRLSKPTQHLPNQPMAAISPKPGSLPTIIRSFKSHITKHARKHNIPFNWQTRFHDEIINDRKHLQNARNYILNNPKDWKHG